MTRASALSAAAVLFTAGVVACGETTSTTTATTVQRGDTTFVANRAPLFPDTVIPVLERSWGRIDGEVDEVFTAIRTFDIGPDGRVYAYDHDRGVRWFEPDGGFGGYLAREGQGPREVGYSTAMRISPTGRIAVWDLGNQKILLRAPDGTVTSVLSPRPWPAYDESALIFDGEDRLWFKFFRHSGDVGILDPLPEYARLEGERVVDTVFVGREQAGDCLRPYDPTYRSGFWEDKRIPWFGSLATALAPDGTLVAGCTKDPYFRVFRPDGSVLAVSWLRAPLPIGDEERSFYRTWQPLPDLPEVRPAYARLIAPGDGRIWVWPTQPPESWTPSAEVRQASGVTTALRVAESGAFEVFDDDGRWRGTVRLPNDVRYSGYPTTPRLRIRGDTLWAIRHDEFDVQSIGRYRIVWPEG